MQRLKNSLRLESVMSLKCVYLRHTITHVGLVRVVHHCWTRQFSYEGVTELFSPLFRFKRHKLRNKHFNLCNVKQYRDKSLEGNSLVL